MPRQPTAACRAPLLCRRQRARLDLTPQQPDRRRRRNPKPARRRSAGVTVRRCLRDLPASIRNQPDSLSAYGSSLLGHSGTWNFGSTVPLRRYLRIVLRDCPMRRSISRIGILSRKCQRRITLNNAMSITPSSPDSKARIEFRTWVTFQWKFMPRPGQLSAEIRRRQLPPRDRFLQSSARTRQGLPGYPDPAWVGPDEFLPGFC